MELTTVIEIISTLGFPIAAVIAMGFFIWKIYKRSEIREDNLQEEIRENRKINGQFAEIIRQHTTELTEIKADVKEIKEDITVISEKIK